MTTPTPLQRLSEIVEAINFDDPLLMGDTRQFERVAARAIRFLASLEAVEALARAICPEGYDWLDEITANPPSTMDDPRLFDPWPQRIERAQDDANRVLNTIAEQALKEPSNG